MIAYKTSRDYKHLIDLLNKGIEVVCFFTIDWAESRKNEKGYKPIITTDVCLAKLHCIDNEIKEYRLSSRGQVFLNYYTSGIEYNYTFLELLEAHDIEYIEPTKELVEE